MPGAVALACLAFAAPAGAVSFTDPALEFGVGADTAPLSVATGDFNEDGNPDVVTANDSAGTVSLMLGDGGGGFALASGWPKATLGGNPGSIVVADFNGDDHLDAAASNRTSNNASVFLGDGAGGVLSAGGGVPVSPSTYAVGANGPFYIDKGDFNADDVVDLVTANQDSNNVSLLLGDGDGTFSSGGTFAVGNTPRGLAVGDVDHDGNDDVVSADFTDPRGAIGTVTVLLGNGAGGVTAAGPAIPVGQNPRWVTLGDFNEDGDPDIAAANAWTNTDSGCPCADTVTILLGAGDGDFAEADDSPFSTGADTGPFAIETADFDGDGHLDLATANRFGQVPEDFDRGFSVLAGDGDGGFASPQFVGSPIGNGQRTGIAIADLNHDTRPDLVSQEAGQGWMIRALNTTPIAVDDSATIAEDSTANAIDVLANDLDPDGIASVDTTGTIGTVAITGGGTGVDYTPDPGYCNDPPDTTPDTFTYALNSGSTATVSVTVTCAPGPHTYYVRTTGSGTVCTQANPCATIADALTAHRTNPQPGDVIDVGPGTFVGNVEADQPEDEGLTIRGALNGPTRQTTLRGEGGGVFGYAVYLGTCFGEEVKLRDANVDTVGADSGVEALSLDGGSDLRNVHASNQPGSDALGVVDVCQRGSTIDRSEIVAEGDVIGLAVFETVRLQDSTVSAENVSAIQQFSGGDPNAEMRIRRSTVSVPADSATPVVDATTRLTVDSSLITGGATGVLTFEGVDWLINNSTIDPGEPGVSDPVNAQSLFLQPFSGSTVDVTVDSSILVDGIFGSASDGGDATVACDFSDIAAVDLDPSFTDDCELGGGSTNTTTPPEDLFIGGAPYDWMLNATSPAIDTGQPGAVPAGLAIRDLAGEPRRQAGTAATCPDGIRDKGAYEFTGPPCELQGPEIVGGASPSPGTKLSSVRGEWNNKPTGFARLWLRCDETGDDCVEIAPPKTRKGYTVRGSDLGHTLRVQVIASNANGDSNPARSDPTGEVTEPPG